MLCYANRLLSEVSLLNYKSKITAETRRAIADLDADVFGFTRAECCGCAPTLLPGSFQVFDHVFLNSTLSPTSWAKRTENVPAYKTLNAQLKEHLPSSTLTVCHTAEYPADTVFRFNLSQDGKGRCTRYAPSGSLTELPWLQSGATPMDCIGDYFLFLCSHKSRDARCGYCGPVLIDLLTQEMREAFPGSGSNVHVVPCSHFGGHVYAGNLLVYSKHGGVCFGCVTPNDAAAIMDFIRRDDGVVPETLKDRVRGRMVLEGK